MQCVRCAAGTVVGAAVGLLRGFINEDGLLQGALVGAVTGALVSVELADSLLRIWTCGDCSMDTRVKRTVRDEASQSANEIRQFAITLTKIA
jgi:hypothetical protein